MAQKRAEVRMIREILRLHFVAGYSDRAISRICGKSHPTVKAIYSNVIKAGYSWPLSDEVDDTKLEAIVYPRKTYAQEWPLPDWEYCGKKKVSMRKEYRAGVNTEVDYAVHIPVKSATCSGLNLPLNPVQTCTGFRSILPSRILSILSFNATTLKY